MRAIADRFLAQWKASFGDALPAGWSARSKLRDRWLRIHSLPASQRYPTSDAERSEVLRRHNEVATEVLGGAEDCFCVISSYAAIPAETEAALQPFIDASFEHVHAHHEEGAGDADLPVQFLAADVTWNTGRFDEVILAIAEDALPGHVLFANPARRTAYAPYDGGADLFLPSEEAIRVARRHWATWISPRADGL